MKFEWKKKYAPITFVPDHYEEGKKIWIPPLGVESDTERKVIVYREILSGKGYGIDGDRRRIPIRK